MSECVSYLAARYLTWLECRSMAVRLGLASHSSDAAASPTPHLPMRSSLSPALPRART